MRLLHSIRKRLNGTYRKAEIETRAKFLGYLERSLREDGTLSPKMRDFYRDLAHEFKLVQKRMKLSMFIGGPASRLIYGSGLGYEAVRKAFEEREGVLVLNGAAVPEPLNASDTMTFILEFYDIVFPHIAGPDFDVFNEGPYEFGEHVRLRPGDVVMDCGANMGFFSAVASARGCTVYAFEPMEYIRKSYTDKTAALNRNITVVPYALSDGERELIFKLHKNIESSHDVTDTVGGIPENTAEDGHFQKVRAIGMDRFVAENGIERVDFIKADIEGAERLMLAGARETMRRFSPKISICTYHLPDDPEVLRNLILDIQPKYKIVEKFQKMYAYVEK